MMQGGKKRITDITNESKNKTWIFKSSIIKAFYALKKKKKKLKLKETLKLFIHIDEISK